MVSAPLPPLFQGSHGLLDLLPTTMKVYLNDQIPPPAHPLLPIVQQLTQDCGTLWDQTKAQVHNTGHGRSKEVVDNSSGINKVNMQSTV